MVRGSMKCEIRAESCSKLNFNQIDNYSSKPGKDINGLFVEMQVFVTSGLNINLCSSL